MNSLQTEDIANKTGQTKILPETGQTEEILKENHRRNELLRRIYDPLKGDCNDPGRTKIIVHGEGDFFLPKTMSEESFINERLRIYNGSEIPRIVLESENERIEFEKIRCRHDFPYWAARYAYIKPKGGGEDVLFVLNRPQRKLVEVLEDMRRKEAPIRLILLKARQWGGSTCVQLYMAWLQLLHRKGLNSLIIAHFNMASREIKDMFDRMLANYPDTMLEDDEEEPHLPKEGDTGKRKKEKRKQPRTERVGGCQAMFRIPSRNCKIKIGTAESPESSRGGDYNLVHFSEVGLWKTTRMRSPEQTVRSACSGVLYRPLTMIVYESTANGTGTFFHREYEAAKRGESGYTPLFVAWYEIEQYSLPFRGEDEKLRFAEKLLSGRNNRSAPHGRCQPGAYLWWLWEKGATLEALNWYVAERGKYSDHGQMAAEYPSDDVEAFVHSGARVFDKYKVEKLRESCRVPLERGEICGNSHIGSASLENVRFIPDSQGCLSIWSHPERGEETRLTERYLVAVDIGGRSSKSDWSVIVVFDRKPMRAGNGPEVVAQWRGHIDFDLLAWKAAAVARYYDNALLVIESNTIDTRDATRHLEGDQSFFLFDRLRDAYPNLYARRQTPDEVREGKPVRYGFHTNISTKPMIISHLVSVIRECGYTERDELCLSEYLTYEQKENGSFGALPGHHDDLLMTRAIGLHVCMNEMEMPRLVEVRPGGLRGATGRGRFSAAVW